MIDKTKMTALEYREWVGKHLNLNKEILQLTQEEVKSLGMSDEETCEHVRRSMADYAAGKTEMPAKIGIHPLHDTFFHAQPADYPDEYACGIKWGACYPANRERFGMPQTTSLYVYNERESGCPLCLMDAVWITENRTAAVAAVSAMAMANTKAEIIKFNFEEIAKKCEVIASTAVILVHSPLFIGSSPFVTARQVMKNKRRSLYFFA